MRHTMQPEHDFNFDEFTVTCSCGWDSQVRHHDLDAAVQAWEDHCDDVWLEKQR